jgi:hypothetical protein
MDRAHEQVAEQPDQEKDGHEVHGLGVSAGLGHMVIHLVLANVINQHRTEDAGSGPGSEQPAVDSTDVLHAEDVAQIRWDGGEATAIHADDDDEAEDEQADTADRASGWHQAVEDHAEDEEHDVGVPAAYEV